MCLKMISLRVKLGDTADIEVGCISRSEIQRNRKKIANSASNTGTTIIQTLSSDQVTNFVVKDQDNLRYV